MKSNRATSPPSFSLWVVDKGTYNPIQVGYGCEGCPASNGNSCKFVSKPSEMTWDADFRPFWEIHGKKPDEKGY